MAVYTYLKQCDRYDIELTLINKINTIHLLDKVLLYISEYLLIKNI